MFDQLDREIANDRDGELTQRESITRNLLIALLSVVVFGGIFLGVWFLE